MENIIKICDLNKSYISMKRNVSVLRNINLEVKKGEFIAIVGPSGSGKSTLMNIIGCLDLPDSGEYILNNKNIKKCNDKELSNIRNKTIGFVFQQFNLLPKLTAIENVMLPLVYMGVSRKKQIPKAMEMLSRVGLEDRINHLPSELSGGQQQRVAIARAMVTEPEILLADEPTGALDQQSTMEVLDIIEKINKDGKTILMITHNLDIAKFANRVISIS